MLNLALAGLKRLWQNGEFSYASSVEDVTQQYLRAANPIFAFLTDSGRCVLGPDNWTSKADLYNAFKDFCIANKLPVLGKESFGRALKNCPEASSVQPKRRRVVGDITYGWQGIGIISGAADAEEVGVDGGGDSDEPGDGGEPPADIPF
jgi:phage/plasmid-associated DNA primase